MMTDHIARREGFCVSHNTMGFHKIFFSDWGDIDAPIMIGVHGFSCNGHDFDWLAHDLAQNGYRFIAVDLPGRGRSDFLPYSADYNFAQYIKDLTVLMAHLGISEPRSVDWIGVSLGGLLGMGMAAIQNSPIKRIIINDIGPYIPKDENLAAVLKEIATEPSFKTMNEFKDYLRNNMRQDWGKISDHDRAQMAENNARALPDGRIAYACDPAITAPLVDQPLADLDLWYLWDAMDQDVLVLRGANSTLFPQRIADEMMTRGPARSGKAKLKIIEGCGHAPSLIPEDQIDVIRNWLQSGR